MIHLWPYYQTKTKAFFRDGKKKAVVEMKGNKVKIRGDKMTKILSWSTGKTIQYSKIKIMKNIFILLLLISNAAIAQKGKPQSIDSVLMENNTLYQFINGAKQDRGSVVGGGGQTLSYNPVWGSYMSVGANAFGLVGQFNLAIGQNAFENNQTGNYNTALGKDVLKMNISGRDNFGAGYDALYNNTSGNANIAMPQDALFSNTTGSNNVALGRGSQYTNPKGNGNVSLGFNTFYYLQAGDENVSIGHYSGGFLEKGYGNIFIGSYAGEMNSAAVGKTINNSIYMGTYTGLSSANSGVIMMGYNLQSTRDNEINIGNVYKGDVSTGVAEVSAISISGRTITADDNYIYVKTSTGETKRVPLQSVVTSAKAIQENQPFVLYGSDGKQLGFFKMVKQ